MYVTRETKCNRCGCKISCRISADYNGPITCVACSVKERDEKSRFAKSFGAKFHTDDSSDKFFNRKGTEMPKTVYVSHLEFTNESKTIPDDVYESIVSETIDTLIGPDDGVVPYNPKWKIVYDQGSGKKRLNIVGTTTDGGHGKVNITVDIGQDNPYHLILKHGDQWRFADFTKKFKGILEGQYGHKLTAIGEQTEGSEDGTWSGVELDKVRKELARYKKAFEDTVEVMNKTKTEVDSLKKQLSEKQAQERVVAVKITKVGEKPRVYKDLFHKEFEYVLNLAQRRLNIMLYGPAGCGKSYLCKQIAKALGLEFYFVSCTGGMSEGVLGGRLLPVGSNGAFTYITSEFVKAYENGGVFLLDEIDAADPNVLLFINAALDGDRVNIPNRHKQPYAIRHKGFICIAAANTVGTGADRLYSGRNRLDNSTLSRFQMGKVYVTYDNLLEEQICPDVDLRTKLLNHRKAIMELGLERDLSTRFMRDAYNLMFTGEESTRISFERVEKALFEGWRVDEVQKVLSFRS